MSYKTSMSSIEHASQRNVSSNMPNMSEREKVAHLLRRFGLGASELELDYYAAGGYTSAVDKLIAYEQVAEDFTLTPQTFAPKERPLNMPGVVASWVLRMLMTKRPLQEKMTLFWHDHFATSASKVAAPLTMWRQNEVLRENATGKFRQLLGQVSEDPAMIFWLDNQENVKGKPNENFAREVMELFTLGIGHYTEKDVQEAARAFTGWSIQRLNREQSLLKNRQSEFLFRPLRHDGGTKTVLGRTGNLSGDDVLDILCEHPRTAEYLTTKIWEWFVYPNPSKAIVDQFSRTFRDSGLHVGTLLKAIMLSNEFVSPKAMRAVVKNPVDFCVASYRSLGVGAALARTVSGVAEGEQVPRPALAPGLQTQQAMKNMGMWLLYPPDVAGWDGGNAWITSATMVERMKWSEKVFGRLIVESVFGSETTAKGLVDRMLIVLDAPIKKEKIPALVQAAEKAGPLSPRTRQGAVVAVGRLIFASPEYQFA